MKDCNNLIIAGLIIGIYIGCIFGIYLVASIL